MGQPYSSTQNSSSGGKGNSGNQITTPATSQQPSYGQPNANATPYSNTVGQWDNAQIGTQATGQQSGKSGKGQSWQPSGTANNWNPSVNNPINNPISQQVAAPPDQNAQPVGIVQRSLGHGNYI